MIDTRVFIQKNIPNDSLHVTLDVKSLYTNTSNNESMKTVRGAYDNHPTKTVAEKMNITFSSLILTLNNLKSNPESTRKVCCF